MIGKCKLGDNRLQVCKNFPEKQSDIDFCGKHIGEKSICIAKIGGEGCNRCGQCCRDYPWGKEGSPETNFENWINKKGTCIYFEFVED